MSDEKLRVVVITVDEYYYIPTFLEPLCSSEILDIASIATVPPSLGTESTPQFALRLLQTFGPKIFAKHGMFYSKYLLLDTFFRWFGVGQPYSPRSVADEYDIPYTHITDVNDPTFVESVREANPDVIVSIAATQKFDSEILDIPPKGAINIHSSLLPDYRGVSPSFWVLLNGEELTGISVHYMSEKIDTGDLITQGHLKIRPDDSQHSLNERIAEKGSDLLLEALDDIRRGSVERTSIDPEQGSYYSMPDRSDVREFLRKGNSFY